MSAFSCRWDRISATPSQRLTSTAMGRHRFLFLLSIMNFRFEGVCLCRMTDLLVGAPMFMVRGSDSRLEEMGRVYTYLQRGPLNLELRPSHLTGTQVFGRYGSTIAPLGDLNQDGFNGQEDDFRGGIDENFHRGVLT